MIYSVWSTIQAWYWRCARPEFDPQFV